jgi:hypothetical protein
VSTSTESDKAYNQLTRIGVTVEKPNIACPIAAVEAEFEKLCRKYPLLKKILKSSSYYGLDTDDREHLKHYFELLVDAGASMEVPETVVVGVPEAEAEEEEDVVFDDVEDDDDLDLSEAA